MGRPKSPKNIPVHLPTYDAQPVLIKSGNNTDWSHDYYKIKELHSKGYTGKGVVIAVLDTGVDLTHSSFQKAISEGRLKSIDARTGSNDPTDRNFHGTWVVSRYLSEGADVLGFAPDCTIISIKVLNDNGSGNLNSIMNGIDIALAEGADIISSSLGWPSHVRAMDPFVQKVKDAGKLWISAAGNDGTREGIDYPALYSDIISVGSINSLLKRAIHSDFGVDLDLYSSGEAVKGAWGNDAEAFLSGTSMATPSLGALIALVWDQIKGEVVDRETLKEISTCL